MRLSFRVSALLGLVIGAPFGLVFGLMYRSLPIGLVSGALFGALFVLAVAVVFAVAEGSFGRRMARLEAEQVTDAVLFRTAGFLRAGRRVEDGVRFAPPRAARFLFTRDSLVVIALEGKKYLKLDMPYRDIEAFSTVAPEALEGEIAGYARRRFTLTLDAPDGVYEVIQTRPWPKEGTGGRLS